MATDRSETAATGRQQADAVLGALTDSVGGGVVRGVYLYGSAVVGGLRPASDLDLLAVIGRRVTRAEREALVDRLMPISGRGTRPPSWRPVEFTAVVQGEVRPWRYPPRCDLQYGEWLRDSFLRGDLEPWPSSNPDVAILLTMVLVHGEPLVGPPAVELLDPVPRGDLVRAIVEEVPGLLDDINSDTRNVLLTLARMWTTVATGEVLSKDAAARWALARLPEAHRAVLARARAAYLEEDERGWDDMPAVRAHAEHVVRQIRAASIHPP
jgi:predicted nucleotidyltransferase